MRIKRWIFAMACLLTTGACAAFPTDGGFSVDVWRAGQGLLPQREVIAITQTRDGYLWLGTLSGLVRFDGVRFTVFDEINTPGLNDNQVVHLFEDSRSNLWVGTKSEGVVLIRDGTATSLGIGRGTREGRLMAACEDSAGGVWLYTADGQLCRYRDGLIRIWRTDQFSNCRTMIAEKSGLIWVGSDSHIFGINSKTNLGNELPTEPGLSIGRQLDFLLASERGGYWCLADGRILKCAGSDVKQDLGPYPWNRTNQVYSACEDREGNLVVGTIGDGVWWFDADGNATQLSKSRKGQGLSSDVILSVLVDREGSLWVGTDGDGLDRVKRQQAFRMVPGTEGFAVQSVCENNEGGLWLNTGGAGIHYWKDGALKDYGLEQGVRNPNGRTIFVDQNQQVWAGSIFAPLGPNLYRLQNDKFQPAPGYRAPNNQEISVLFQDRQGQLWVGTQGGLARWNGTDWKTFTTREGLSSDAVQAMAEDVDGSLWIGTGNGLNHFRDGKFIAFHRKDGLPDDDISSLYIDPSGVLWMGTHGRGLGRFHDGKWTSFTTSKGLLSDSVGYIIEDGDGYLWLGSNVGVMRVKKQELNNVALGLTNSFFCRVYAEPDGLLAGECTMGSQPGACRSRDGRLWFPTIKGLVSVDPAQIIFNTNAPPVVIESVLINGVAENNDAVRSTLPSLVTVPASKESVEIRYTSLNLATAKKARFKYRMEGYETAWTKTDGDTRSVRYPKLPPGHYLFHVTACNEDEVWNETGATLAFFVEPPFWQTWWFRGAAALALLGLIVGIVHYLSTQRLQRQLEGMRQQQALEKERSRIARDIHDQLGASLTQVSLLGEMVESDKENPAEVEAHARQISQTARDTSRALDEIVWTVNPSNDTLDGLINYICKYAQEYFAVAGVRYRLDIPAQLPANEISPEVRHNVFLAAKEAVTNVVKHAKATEVWLRLRIEPDRVILELQDNGRGPSGLEQKQSRNGLRNMHKRMEDIGGSFELSTVPEGGALVRLTVPISNR